MFFWNSLVFFHDPADVGNWSLVPLPFLKPAWTSGCSRFTYCCCTGTGGPRGAIPRWRLGTVAVKRYPLSKVRNSSCALLEQPWRDTPRQGKRNSSKMVSVARGHQRADTLKPYSQKLVNLITLGPCLTQWNQAMPAGQPKMGGSWWRGLTECGPLEKGMASHFSTPWTVGKEEV